MKTVDDSHNSITILLNGMYVLEINCLLFHVADKYIRKLQRVQNLVARIILNIPIFDHVSPVLQSLHWLPIKARIEFRILVIVWYIKLFTAWHKSI